MATTLRTSAGHPVTLDLSKQGRNALWEVHQTRGMGLAKEAVYIGRLMGPGDSGGDWYSEYGFGWTGFPTRKAALADLVEKAGLPA